MARPDYLALGRPGGSRCDRFGRGRPAAAERHARRRSQHADGGASGDRRQATGGGRFAARRPRVPRRQGGRVRSRSALPGWRAAVHALLLRARMQGGQSRRAGRGNHQHYRHQTCRAASARQRNHISSARRKFAIRDLHCGRGFYIMQVSAGAQRKMPNVRPLIGHDLAEVLLRTWPEPFASDAIGRFRHTLATGEPYDAPGAVERRKDTGAVESYDWKIERVTMPDGRFGVVCHFYDLSERQKYEAALRESETTFRVMFDATAA